jgi:hypothetical protein
MGKSNGNESGIESQTEPAESWESRYESLIQAANDLKGLLEEALRGVRDKTQYPGNTLEDLIGLLTALVTEAGKVLPRLRAPSCSEETRVSAVAKLNTDLLQIYNRAQLLNSVIDLSRSQNLAGIFDMGTKYGPMDED